MVRTGPRSFFLHLHRYGEDEDIQVILEKFNLALEEAIRSVPDQWVWFHKRWKTREGGQVLRSREYINWLKAS